MALTKITGDVIATNTSITAVGATFTGNVSVAGTITYEDVTDIDSVGLITARSGVNITGGGLIVTGISTVSAGSTSAPSISPSGDSNTGIFFPSADTIAFGEGGSETARIDSSGRLLVGKSSSRGNFYNSGSGYAPLFQVEGTAAYSTNQASALSVVHNSTDDWGGTIYLGKSKSSSVGGNGLISSGDTIGRISFQGADGSELVEAARIDAMVDGTSGANDMPGRLVFSTTADGASSPTERLRITSDGKLGLGTTSPVLTLDVKAATDGLFRVNNSNETSHGSHDARIVAGGTYYQNPVIVGSAIKFNTYNGSAEGERARIDTSGRLLVGTSTAPGVCTLALKSNSAGVYGARAVFQHTSTSPANGDDLGILHFADGSTSSIAEGAKITGARDGGTWTSGSSHPGRLVFSTTADGASSPTERMRLDSSGRLGLGTSTPDQKLHVVASSGVNNCVRAELSGTATYETAAGYFVNTDTGTGSARGLYVSGTDFGVYSNSGTNFFGGNVGIGTTSPVTQCTVYGSASAIQFQNTNTGSASGDGFYVGNYGGLSAQVWQYENDVIQFGTNNTERARIDSSGRLLVGTTTAHNNSRFVVAADGSAIGATFYAPTTSTYAVVGFNNPNGEVGRISTNSSSTTYGTGSDYRLKENIVPLTGAVDRVNQLQVRRFNFIADPDTTVDGFIAHEAQAVVPEAVTGTKDEVDADGNPVYQGIDQSKLVPLLTAALQEAIGRIEQLESINTTLLSENTSIKARLDAAGL